MGIRIGIFHNTSGLITRGLGELNKLLTRGLGPSKHIIKGEAPKVRFFKEYLIDISSGVRKKNYIVRNIISSIKVSILKGILMMIPVKKEVTKSVDMKAKVDSKKLFRILDAI